MPDRVDDSVDEVPVPDYYLMRSDTGLYHLVDPSEKARTEYRDQDTYTARCGRTFHVENELQHTTDWLTPDDVVDRFTADELFDEFKPFAGQCKNCLTSHQADGAEDFAGLSLD